MLIRLTTTISVSLQTQVQMPTPTLVCAMIVVLMLRLLISGNIATYPTLNIYPNPFVDGASAADPSNGFQHRHRASTEPSPIGLLQPSGSFVHHGYVVCCPSSGIIDSI
jgi:hypothetical protein